MLVQRGADRDRARRRDLSSGFQEQGETFWY
jgi:hypothetical protein